MDSPEGQYGVVEQDAPPLSVAAGRGLSVGVWQAAGAELTRFREWARPLEKSFWVSLPVGGELALRARGITALARSSDTRTGEIPQARHAA
jgi:hypothetical protein